MLMRPVRCFITEVVSLPSFASTCVADISILSVDIADLLSIVCTLNVNVLTTVSESASVHLPLADDDKEVAKWNKVTMYEHKTKPQRSYIFRGFTIIVYNVECKIKKINNSAQMHHHKSHNHQQ